MTCSLEMVKKFIPGWKLTMAGCTANKNITLYLWFSRYFDRFFHIFGFLSFGFSNTFSFTFWIITCFNGLCDTDIF